MFFLFLIVLALVILSVLIYVYKKENAAAAAAPIVAAAPEPVREIERQIEQVKVEQKPPEVVKLGELVERFEADTTAWDTFIAIGDIYRKGAYPRFLPNEEIALRIYKVAAMCPNGEIAGLAQTKYIEAYDEPIKSIDKAGEMLPITYALQACDIAENVIKSTPWSAFEKPKQVKAKVEPPRPLPTVLDFFGELPTLMGADDGDATVPAYRIDGQNVHDHGVSTITKYNLDKMSENIDITRLGGGFDDIRAAILDASDASANEKADAVHVIDKLTDHVHSTYNMSEKDALRVTWDKIQKSEHRDNLVGTLAKQLASAVEHGHVVCSTGKISRIVSTMDGVENEQARPTWALKEEIAGKAAQIRDKIEDSGAAREEFARQIRADYVDKLGMSSKIIQKYIDEYSEGF